MQTVQEAAAAANRASTYSLANDESEYRRLVSQARIWEPATRRALDAAGLAAGASALDVGCGPGEVMRLMAERVGASGRVLGVDLNAALGEYAVAQLNRAAPAVCRFVRADINQPATLPAGSFDLVFARFLLFHMRQPVDVLRRLWQLVAPGGALLVMDYDMTAIRPVPAPEAAAAMVRATAVMKATFERVGCGIDIGARLPLLFEEAGIGRPDGHDVSGLLAPATDTVAMLGAVLDSLRVATVGAGLIGADDWQSLRRDLADAGNGDWMGRWPDMVAAWKRRS